MSKSRMLNLKRLQSLSLLAAMLLSGCGPGSYNVPPWPVAGPRVADELERYCSAEDCPATWEWLGRVDVFKRQLDIATESKDRG